jgi:hypothetical protein
LSGKTAPLCLSAHLLRTALGSLLTTEQRFSQLHHQLEQQLPKNSSPKKSEKKSLVEPNGEVNDENSLERKNSENPILLNKKPSIPLDVKKAAKYQMDSMIKLTPRIPRSFLGTIEDVVEKMIYRYHVRLS